MKRAVLVTGGWSGIGEAMVKGFSACGGPVLQVRKRQPMAECPRSMHRSSALPRRLLRSLGVSDGRRA